jgi:hypothetical protein
MVAFGKKGPERLTDADAAQANFRCFFQNHPDFTQIDAEHQQRTKNNH